MARTAPTTTAKTIATQAKGPAKKAAPKTTAAKKTPSSRVTVASTVAQQIELSLAEQQAAALAQAALWIDQATSAPELGGALQHNMNVWVGIRTMTESPASPLPSDTRANLIQLADYVAASTLNSANQPLTTEQVQTFININLQIAEGLLEGEANRVTAQEAYRLWESEGRPAGKDQEHWFQAESQVSKRMDAGQKALKAKAKAKKKN